MSTLLAGCNLNENDLAEVAAHYARAAAHYQAVVRYDRDGADLDLHGDKAKLAALLRQMIAREGQCCTHLQFDLTETAHGYRVELRSIGSREGMTASLRDVVGVLFPAAMDLREMSRT